MSRSRRFPTVLDPARVGTYPAKVFAGGGLVWDAVLEYRVWCHPEDGSPETTMGEDYFEPFARYFEALAFSKRTKGAEEPLALVLQREYLDEEEPGHYVHRTKQRMTEWPVEFLRRPRRTARTILDFLSSDAPPNRLAILRGNAKPGKKRLSKKAR